MRLREHLEDLGWVERTARAHERVLEQVLRSAALVPLRLCTLYRDVDGVRHLLRESSTSLTEALAKVAGRTEWGVKVLADPSVAGVEDDERVLRARCRDRVEARPGQLYVPVARRQDDGFLRRTADARQRQARRERPTPDDGRPHARHDRAQRGRHRCRAREVRPVDGLTAVRRKCNRMRRC